MALTIYYYKNENINRGFILTAIVKAVDEVDLKVLKNIVENHCAASCVGVTLAMDKIPLRKMVNIFVKYVQDNGVEMIAQVVK